jgi:hypothetical protein
MLLTPLSFQGSSFWGPKNLQKMKKPKLPTAARKVFDKGRKLEKNNNTQKREMQNFRAVEEQIIQKRA